MGKEKGEEMSMDLSPALPKWEGGLSVDEGVDFPSQWLECVPAFPLSHACIVTDLTPIVTVDRRVRLPLSQGRGHGVGFFSWLMRVIVV